MKALEGLVMGLADREAIRDLPVRYCDCVWRADIDGIVDLFTEDGSFTAPRSGREIVTQGRHALHKMYSEGPGFVPRPYVHNHVVFLQGKGRATGRCYTEIRAADRNMEWIGSVWYADEYAKVGDSWKFASRHVTASRIDEEARPTRPDTRKHPARKKATPAKRAHR
jgi:hypothetical protein